ncbi:hypothetical protein J2786_002629 [Chryseobacterium vietnamense]|uniref:Uncharacterized protein n=1 Tax=Chryseobacterium vietnamense TaxID=866785 RepID=A0ACC6J9P6_9FLAO|nr:hypothetical protein [Chryseobacterium vietnamense]MDR6459522.1 hypothetical protein [Chryseobacterium vietnamense]
MNLKPLVFLTVFTLISLSCNNSKKELNSNPISEPIDSIAIKPVGKEDKITESSKSTKTNYENKKVKKIDSKKEERTDGNFNQMTLFEVNKDISLDQLKDYCSSVKPNYTNGYFQILVFFKNADAARFPANPVTGSYTEERDLKNIKAIYTINNINGYSKLDYYEKNNWESIAQTTDID